MVQYNDFLTKIPAYFGQEHITVEVIDAICSQTTNIEDYPFAAAVEQNLLIYEGDTFRQVLNGPEKETALKVELCLALKDGPGVFVLKNAYPDISVIDQSTAIFHEIVAQEKAVGLGEGDHFGKNERIWNSIQKACVKNPDLFIDYYGNPILAISCEAWLGPFYQISAQMNNVTPGSKAQSMHRDYHLGFSRRRRWLAFRRMLR